MTSIFFFQAEDGIRDWSVTGVQTCALPILPHVKSGALRALAVTDTTRSPQLPDVPTMQEAGVKGFQFTQWLAVLAPAGTPGPVIAQLNAALNKIGRASCRERV